jgi:flagellar biogenesis protein FliO
MSINPPTEEQGGQKVSAQADNNTENVPAQKRRKKVQRDEMKQVELNLMPMLALFTILLCYLLKNYSSDPAVIKPAQGTELPRSTTTLSPQESVQVVISDRVILVGDQKVAIVKDGRVAAEFKKNNNPASMYIEPLYTALKKAADKQKMIAKYNKKKKELAFQGLLTVVADKRIPFRLLTEVLFTAGYAEYGQYKFAVLKTEG